MQESADINPTSHQQSTEQLVHVLMHFALAVRHRFQVLLATLLIVSLLGALYYMTATRFYSAKASLLVLQSGSATLTDPSLSNEGNRQQSMMPTYENIVTSTKVIDSALRMLQPEDRIDMQDVPRESWGEVIQKNLSSTNLYNTNILEIEYRSKDPQAAVAVVNAISKAYLDFMDEKHKGTASEIIQILSKEKGKIEQDLDRKERELLLARMEIGDMQTLSDSRTPHPLISKVLSLNDALVETQKKRVELESLLAAIRYSIHNGEDLQQHINTVNNVVGKELMLRSVGFNPQDAQTYAANEKIWLEDTTELNTLEKDLLPGHPKVIALRDKIQLNEQYLRGYQERLNQHLNNIHDTQLAPFLTNTIQQQLSETVYREQKYLALYNQTQSEACDLIGKLGRIEILEHRTRWLREFYDMLRKRISGLDLKHEGPDIRTDELNPPVVDNRPISPSLKRVVLMVIVVGIGLGLMGIYVIDTLDDRFRSVEELQRYLNTGVLAIIRQLESRPEKGVKALQVYHEPDAVESEAFRTLRTALSLTDTATSQIVISSAEPGDGKTTVLANLAVSYAQSGKRTLLIDADLRRPGLTAMLGYRQTGGLSNVLRATDAVEQSALSHIRDSGVEQLDVLSSGPRPMNPAELLTGSRFAELLCWAETTYDQIFVDSPPTLAASDTAIIGRLVDGVILVVQPDKNRRRLVVRAAESFHTLGIHLLGVVVNRISTERGEGYYGYGVGYGYAYQYGNGNDDQQKDNATSNIHLDRETTLSIEPVNRDSNPAERIVPRRVA